LPVYTIVLIVSIPLYRIDRVKIPRVTTGILIFLMFGGFSTLLAAQTGISSSGLVVLLTRIFVLFAIVLTLDTRRWVYRGWIVLVVLTVISFGIAGIEIFYGWHWTGSRLTEVPNLPRYSNWASAWYVNINNFSVFALIGTIPALVLSLNPNTDYRARMLFSAVWITGFVITLQIYSRAVMLAYPFTIVTAVALMRSYNISKIISQVSGRIAKLILTLIGGFLTVIFYSVSNPFNNEGSSLWIRWQLQKAAVMEGGILGQGLGSASYIISGSSINTGGIANPHSWYGVIVSETGILGLVLFLIFYGGLLTELSQNLRPKDSVRIMSITALVALPVAGLGPSNVLRMPTWWIVIGLAVATCNYMITDSKPSL